MDQRFVFRRRPCRSCLLQQLYLLFATEKNTSESKLFPYFTTKRETGGIPCCLVWEGHQKCLCLWSIHLWPSSHFPKKSQKFFSVWLNPPLKSFSKGQAIFQTFSSPSQSWYKRVLHIVSLANRYVFLVTLVWRPWFVFRRQKGHFFLPARLTDYMDFYDTYMSNIS